MKQFVLVMACLFVGLYSKAFAGYELISVNVEELSNSSSDSYEGFSRSDLSGVTLGSDAYYIPTIDGFLEKRSNAFHSVVWKTRLSAASQSSWTLDQNQLFGGDTKGQFYSIDATTGAILWKTPTKGVFFSRPLVKGNQVFVVNSHGILQSYERSTGQWLWQQNDPGTGSLGLWSQQGPVFFQGYIVNGFPSATLVAFDLQTGKPAWNESFSDKLQGADNFNDLKALHASTEMLFASSFSGDLRAWEAAQGSKKLVWEKRLSLHAPMTLDEKSGVLYLSARDGKVYAIDAKTGFLKWDYELPRGLGTQPTIANGQIWVGTSSGLMVVLSQEGKLLARSNDYQMPIWNSIAVLENGEALAITARANMRRLRLVKVN